MAPVTPKSRLANLRKEYAEMYDIEGLKSGNDRVNLETLLANQIIIEDLQKQIQLLMDDPVKNVNDIKKLSDTLKDFLDRSLALERSLGIDRKSRISTQNVDNPATYIMSLKQLAQGFLDQRLIKVFCPTCNVMVMRFSPVHDHTEFQITCACSQCGKAIRAYRKGRDIFYDLPANDREWRKKYPIEVQPPKRITATDTEKLDALDDDIVLTDETENE